MLSKLFSKKPPAPKADKSISYEDARSILEKKDIAMRRDLAAHPDARPEMLYYLAGDESAEVRRRVAENKNTPYPANRILAEDSDDDVRFELARKIAKLLPGLDEKEQVKLREQTIEVLEMLAEDQLPRVRQIIAEELKSADNIPKNVVLKLAHDLELTVCAPILEYSPLLNSDDLREIIATTKVQGALASIARRTGLDADVSNDVAATLDVPAVAALLANPSAQIREETLDAIIDHAENIYEWHEPIVFRPNLSLRAMRRISTFVAASLIDHMIETNDIPPDLMSELRQRVMERIKTDEFSDEEPLDIRQQAERLIQQGEIADDYMGMLIEKGRNNLVIELVSLKAELPSELIQYIIEIGHSHGVTALAWRAGLSMRTAMAIQGDLAHIPASERLNARNGVDYPLTEKELQWQIDYFLDRFKNDR